MRKKHLDAAKFNVSLSFKEISLPPFRDILLLTKTCQQGCVGISQAFHFLAPEKFEFIEIKDPTVEAMLINKSILKRINIEKVLDILKKSVFPYITCGEIVKVDFDVTISYENIAVE